MLRTYLILLALCSLSVCAKARRESTQDRCQRVAEPVAQCMQSSINWFTHQSTADIAVDKKDVAVVAQLQQLCFDLFEQLVDNASNWYSARRSLLDNAAEVCVASCCECATELTKERIDRSYIEMRITQSRSALKQLEPVKREVEKSDKLKQID